MAKSGFDILRKSIHQVIFSSRTKDLVIFCFALAISFGFWILQKLDDTFEVEYEIPLELVGVPRDVVVTTSLPKTVTVTIRDRGTNLAQYFRSAKLSKPIALNFSMYELGITNGVGIIPLKDVSHAVQMRLASTTQVVSILPDTLDFYFNNGNNVKLPVCVCGELTTTKDHYINHISFYPDSITVYAPKAITDTMRCVYTQAVEMRGLSRTTTKNVSFLNRKGVKYSPNSAMMNINVDYYTEQETKVPIVGLNFPADKALRTFPAVANVTYRVGNINARRLKAEDFVIAMTYEELMNNSSNKYLLHLKSIPDGVFNVRIEPREVEYLIETTEENDTE